MYVIFLKQFYLERVLLFFSSVWQFLQKSYYFLRPTPSSRFLSAAYLFTSQSYEVRVGTPRGWREKKNGHPLANEKPTIFVGKKTLVKPKKKKKKTHTHKKSQGRANGGPTAPTEGVP